MTFKQWMRATVGTALLCAVSTVSAGSPAAADSIRDRQWALPSLDAGAIGKVSTGRGVTVAVVDTGVDGTHPDLKGSVLPGENFILDHGRADRETESAHGTAMASLIAGHGHGPGGTAGIKGLAPAAKILPLRVNTDDNMGFGKGGRGGPVAQAIRYAADHGASVINLSLGDSLDESELEDAVQYARQKDAVLIAAAGNDGTKKREFPASYPGVIAVGAVDSSDKIWKMSNYGPHVMLSAPGVDVYHASLDHDYEAGDGTSDATAYVSAAAALLRSKFPHLTAGQIANRLVKTAQLPASAKGAKLPDKHYGYGMIRPYRALTEDIAVGSKNGPLPAPSATSPAAAAPTDSADPESSSGKDLSAYIIWGFVGVAVLGFLTVLTVAIVRRRRPVVPPPSPFGEQPPGPPFRQ